MRWLAWCLIAVLTFLSAFGTARAVRADPGVTVFAAASLKTALDEVARQFTLTHDVPVSLSYAGSSALARQIQYGAPADIFLSANNAWMDMLEKSQLLEPGTRIGLLGNRLVLIAGAQTDAVLTIGPGMDLVGALRGKRLAMALTGAVPAGIYGRAALISLGVWDSVRPHVAETENVRAALRLVALGEAPLGIVYATDALAEPRVRVVGVFAKASHPPIIYPLARLAGANTPDVLAFFQYLRGPGALAVFRAHGFGPGAAEPS